MIFALHIIFLCLFTLRSYAGNVLPVSYAWSTFTGPVSGDVQQVKPYRPSSSSSSEFGENSNDETETYGPDYVAKPDYSFAYGVENPNTGDSHGHSETRDGSTVTGEYSVMEPDGVLRRVQYTADPKNGFRASIRYVRPDGETTDRDHGYEPSYDRTPGSRPSPPSPPPPPGPASSMFLHGSEDESADDGDGLPYVPVPKPPSLQNFNFDGFDSISEINNHIGDHGDSTEDDGGGDYGEPSPFKFPSLSGSLFKTTAADDTESEDYSDKYYHRGSAPASATAPSPFDLSSSSAPFEHSSSPSPYGLSSTPSLLPSSTSFGLRSSPLFGLPSSPSPSFGGRPPQIDIGCGPPPPPPPSPSSQPPSKSPQTPQPPSLRADVENYGQTGHSDRFSLPPSRSVNDDDDEDDTGSYQKVANGSRNDVDDDDRGENVNSTDDTEVDTANMKADFRTLPFIRPSKHKRPPIVVAQFEPAPFSRPSPRPFRQSLSPHPIELAPSPPAMISIVPTIIDI